MSDQALGSLAMVTQSFNAREVLHAQPLTRVPTASGISFFNVSITARHAPELSPALVGSGVYGLFQRRSEDTSADLIYIGKYQGHRDQPFAGNVAQQRWWTHIASVTARGDRMSISRRTAQYLKTQHCLGADIKSFRELAVDATQNEVLFQDRGCVAGLNRILFALRHWDQFRPESNPDLLAPFFFHYVRLVPQSTVTAVQAIQKQSSVKALRSLISQAENALIQQLNPPCNHQAQADSQAVTMTPEAFEHHCVATLNRVNDGR